MYGISSLKYLSSFKFDILIVVANVEIADSYMSTLSILTFFLAVSSFLSEVQYLEIIPSTWSRCSRDIFSYSKYFSFPRPGSSHLSPFNVRERHSTQYLFFILPFALYLFYLVSTETLPYFFDAAIVYAAKYATLDTSWFIRRSFIFLLVYPPGRLVMVCSLITVLIWRKIISWSNHYNLLAIFVLGSFVSLLVQRRLAYYHSMPFCYFGSAFVIIAICGSQHLSKVFHQPILKALTREKVVVWLLILLILPVGIDLPRSIFSLLSGQSAAEYGDSQRLRRGLAPWSLVQQVGNLIQSSTRETTQFLCVADSESPEYYLAVKRNPVHRYVMPQQLLFDMKRVSEALTTIKNSKKPLVMLIKSKTILDPQPFFKAATESSDVKCIFSENNICSNFAH